jgi:hypothetical protein
MKPSTIMSITLSNPSSSEKVSFVLFVFSTPSLTNDLRVVNSIGIEGERVRTTIPIHEVTHEAPVVHQPQSHEPVALENFLSSGGSLQGGIPQNEIARKVLHSGKCIREIDGAAADPTMSKV